MWFLMSSLVSKILARPYFIFSFLAVFVSIGIYGYINIKRDLFPNSNRPEVALIVPSPSMSAKDIASTIVVPIEKELYTLEKVRRVYSSTNDEVSIIKVEFEYGKSMAEAISDVKNSFDAIKRTLPPELPEPIIYKITQTTAPVMVIGVSSPHLALEEIRQLSQEEIKTKLLKIEGVSNVELFGGYTKELRLEVSKKRLDTLAISMEELLVLLRGALKDYAIGVVENDQERFILKSTNTHESIANLGAIAIKNNLTLHDIAKIRFEVPLGQALYYGNAKPSVALAIQRSSDVGVLDVIERVESTMKELQAEYGALHFEITDSQKSIIEQSTSNMIEGLRDAIIMSMLVVFLFLASVRQIIVVFLTIPIVYLSTIALMYLLGIEFNVITLTGVILALGLLLDDTVVVVENIERHFSELKKPIRLAVHEGTSEIMFADFSGTLTTMIAISPILFVGDYPQTVFGPLIGVLLLALIASYIVSITFVPLISLHVLAWQNPIIKTIEAWFTRFSHVFNRGISDFFVQAYEKALAKRWVALSYIAVLMVLFGVSLRIVMPLVGQELMPAMDTGTVRIKVSLEDNTPLAQTEVILKEVLEKVQKAAPLVSTSAWIGAEAGILGIGGGTTSQLSVIANYVNRFERELSIWKIQEGLRQEIATLGGIKRVEVSDAGATALASIKANVTVTLMGEDTEALYAKALEYEEAMKKTQGVVNTSKTWDLYTKTYDMQLDQAKLAYFGVTQEQVYRQLNILIKGVNVGSLPIQNAQAIPIKLSIEDNELNSIEKLSAVLITTKLGLVPLSTFGSISERLQPDTITRENLFYTIDVLGFRENISISHLNANFDSQSKDITLPQGMRMKHNGDIAQFQDSSKRIIKAVIIGIVLIFLVMVPMFESLKIPLIIILSIPLTIAGAAWVLLLFDYHSSMSAMIGFVLLAGVVVNNAILLIHFALEQMRQGKSSYEAMRESIILRTRPVLMTAISVSVGMIPVAFGWAIGLERLAPLGAVVLGGLLVGTLLTLIFIPLFFVWVTAKRTKEYV